MKLSIPDVFERGFTQAYESLTAALNQATETGEPATRRLQLRFPVRVSDAFENYVLAQAFSYGVNFGILQAKHDFGPRAAAVIVDTGLRFEPIVPTPPEPPEPNVAAEPFPYKVYERDRPYEEWSYAAEAESLGRARLYAHRLQQRAGKLTQIRLEGEAIE